MKLLVDMNLSPECVPFLEQAGFASVHEPEWAGGEDLDTDALKLSPVSKEIFPLALEDWQIWRRWEVAFHRGEATQETHPALPEDRVSESGLGFHPLEVEWRRL